MGANAAANSSAQEDACENAREYATLLSERDLNQPEERKRALYAAFSSRDTRFDGQVFVGVSSTGIYCRTVCTAHLPKFENCTFFHTAAQAESAGYRPCMTCHPEAAPGLSNVDARASLARRAASLLREECASGSGVEALAAKLGYTGRHLRRAFVDEYGTTPAQYVRTCRLLLAKSLLTDSDLPVSQVSQASGFGSVRRFNDAFKRHYHLTPTDVRKRKRGQGSITDGVTVKLGYRPPYRFDDLLAFFRARALEGVELVDDVSYSRVVRLSDADGHTVCGWARVQDLASRNALGITVSESLLPCMPQVIARLRRQFDVDCDPQAVQEGISSLVKEVPGAVVEGVRLPGCFDPFEIACRAILGQQVSVKAANKLAARIVSTWGARVESGVDGLTGSFPTPVDILALDDVEGALGKLGVVKSRSRAIAEIARLIVSGELDLGAGAVVSEQMERLLAVKGIGPWTANYIAMRAMSHPDAFLETDAGVAHALPDLAPKERLELAERWRPWRSYAVISMWNALTDNI